MLHLIMAWNTLKVQLMWDIIKPITGWALQISWFKLPHTFYSMVKLEPLKTAQKHEAKGRHFKKCLNEYFHTSYCSRKERKNLLIWFVSFCHLFPNLGWEFASIPGTTVWDKKSQLKLMKIGPSVFYKMHLINWRMFCPKKKKFI